MSLNQSLISPTANAALDAALRAKLKRRADTAGNLGELEPLAVRLGLIQNTLKPRFRNPQIVFFASDHGLAVEGVGAPEQANTLSVARRLLTAQLPVSVFSFIQGLELSVVDCGIADAVAPHARLMSRKIAHGTRNARIGPAMTLEQAHASIRAGMEIADALPGNVVCCAGIGVGSAESAALVMSRLSGAPVRDLTLAGTYPSQESLAKALVSMQGALARHRDANDPVEALATLGGFEMGAMVGVMLVAGSKRHLIMIDGMAACAALMIAARIAPAVTDYCVFSRSHSHRGLDVALSLFHASALLELGMESTDGTGSTLAWPLVRSAAALLTEVAEGEDPGPSQLADMAPAESAPATVATGLGPASAAAAATSTATVSDGHSEFGPSH
jgi:nicotinate-nucleotide--dimethylbenzimidazole phosphoribosyltransferase